jgi:uncharacterized membrane protein
MIIVLLTLNIHMNNIIDILSGEVNISKKERIISVAGGVGLIVAGLLMKKRNALSWSEVGTGAALLLRGVTGHCPVNAAINRNTAAPELAEEAEKNFESVAE